MSVKQKWQIWWFELLTFDNLLLFFYNIILKWLSLNFGLLIEQNKTSEDVTSTDDEHFKPLCVLFNKQIKRFKQLVKTEMSDFRIKPKSCKVAYEPLLLKCIKCTTPKPFNNTYMLCKKQNTYESHTVYLFVCHSWLIKRSKIILYQLFCKHCFI